MDPPSDHGPGDGPPSGRAVASRSGAPARRGADLLPPPGDSTGNRPSPGLRVYRSRETVRAVFHPDRARSGVLPRMSESAGAVRSGRRGRRTAGMVRIARERLLDLFGLAEGAAARGDLAHADRYVGLAREIGARYNVRLLPEFKDLYCRGCSCYWVEGRTVRTRLRSAHRVQTCLRCGRVRRTRTPPRSPRPAGSLPSGRRPSALPEEALNSPPYS